MINKVLIPFKKYSLTNVTTLDDRVSYFDNGVYDGCVTLINKKGVGVQTPNGYKFIKWINVIENYDK